MRQPRGGGSQKSWKTAVSESELLLRMVRSALGDPTRRAIFESLARGPLTVGELAAELPVSRPAVSQHLKVLREAGLVTGQAGGTRRRPGGAPPRGGEPRSHFDSFWAQALAAVARQRGALP